jgi:hypothetical protein
MPRVLRDALASQELVDLPPRPIPTTLRHGQVIWLLTELGYGLGGSKNALQEYLKGLRKLGIPFGHVTFQSKSPRRLAKYSYSHIMELVIVMSLRVYHVIPDSVLKEIIRYRRRLSRMYVQAYELRDNGAGAPIILKNRNNAPIELRGMFLDLDIRFSAGRLSHFKPPRLLTSFEALEIFSKGSLPGRVFLPMNLSILTERVTAVALAAHSVRGATPGPRRKRFSS